MDLTEVQEGATTLRVPSERAGEREGPGAAGGGFYNPAMALTRDLSVLVARALVPGRGAHFLDGLAATGARGLRVATEAKGWTVELNDHHPHAADLVRENAKRLGLDVVVHRRDLNALLTEGTWRFIEVDPYGPPVPFLAAATQALRHDGLLGLSATDTAALHGSRPSVARRRYLAEPPPRGAPGWKAAALRLFVGHAVRAAAQFDVGLRPILVHEHGHAFRATFASKKGATVADEALASLGTMVLCAACQTWGETSCACGKGRASGPYWLGPLQDTDVLGRLITEAASATLACPHEVPALLRSLEAEARLGPFYMDVDAAASVAGVAPPRTSVLVGALAEVGIDAVVSHHGPKQLAHDGTAAAVLDVVRDVGNRT